MAPSHSIPKMKAPRNSHLRRHFIVNAVPDPRCQHVKSQAAFARSGVTCNATVSRDLRGTRTESEQYSLTWTRNRGTKSFKANEQQALLSEQTPLVKGGRCVRELSVFSHRKQRRRRGRLMATVYAAGRNDFRCDEAPWRHTP